LSTGDELIDAHSWLCRARLASMAIVTFGIEAGLTFVRTDDDDTYVLGR
jgi:hypothetical protein